MKQPVWIDYPTPNLGRRSGTPQGIVLHHTGGNLNGDLATLTSETAAVSADFEVARNGKIYKLNPDLVKHYCWHAGKAEWHGKTDVNNLTIGIEMEHLPGRGWPDAQVEACAKLCRWLVHEGKVETAEVQSHAFVAKPTGRKNDPEAFPWAKFWHYYYE